LLGENSELNKRGEGCGLIPEGFYERILEKLKDKFGTAAMVIVQDVK